MVKLNTSISSKSLRKTFGQNSHHKIYMESSTFDHKCHIAALMTCHNRRETTLRCLKSLKDQKNLDKVTLDIYLVDDGCTDGTASAVKVNFPEVIIIQGDGNLFWNGGMRLAWETALKRNYDYYLWLNDDLKIYLCSIKRVLISANATGNKSIICGATEGVNNICTYSAYAKITRNDFEKLIPNGHLQKCQVFNGNFVLIPNAVYAKLGNLDSVFSHGLSDFDYGLRASKINISSYLMPGYVGFCEDNITNRPTKRMRIIERFKLLYSPLGNNPFLFFKYNNRHFGFFIALKHFISNHFKTLFNF